MKTFKDVISLWPSPVELANDIQEQPETVRKWRSRDKIPSCHWSPIIAAAKKRKFKVTAVALAEIASKRVA